MKNVKTYAELLLKRDVPYEEILREESLRGVTREQLRVWKSRLKKSATKKANVATKSADETQLATLATDLQRSEATQESAAQPLENAAKTSVFVDFCKTTLQNFHPADALYFGSILLACNGVANSLHNVGGYVAAFYFAVAFVALQGVKTTTGAWRWLHIAVLLVVEVLVGGVAHVVWANEALWANVTALPIEIQQTYGGQMWIGRGIETPFKIACGVAAFFVSSGFYACLIALKKK